MKRTFEIHFFNTKNGFELVETKFTSFSEAPRHCVRGKTSGAFRGSGTFQWTTAVRAISALFLRHVLSQKVSSVQSLISGGNSSLAASLDYALSKAPRWIEDMFGAFNTGQIAAKRLFMITNPNQKRSGPVVIAVNDIAISPRDVRVMMDGIEVFEPVLLLEILRDVENVPEPAMRVREIEKSSDFLQVGSSVSGVLPEEDRC